MNKKENPWINISASDYEGHMSAPNVAQQAFLNSIIKQLLLKHRPSNLAFAGCTTGNGFEHINFTTTKSVVGIDINKEYLQIAREKFSDERIKLIHSDLCTVDLGKHLFDLIHCALIFEYIDVEEALNNLINHLAPAGQLSVVLQLPSEGHSVVSKTDFPSLESLSSFVHLVAPEEFENRINSLGLTKVESRKVTLPSGKGFFVGLYKR